MSVKKPLKYHLLAIFATLLVAASFLSSERLAGVINPFSLTLLRFCCAAVILLPVVLSKKRWRDKILSTMPRALAISFFYASFFIALFESLNFTSSLNTSTLFTLVPFLTALISIVVFRQAITIKQVTVYLIGFFGTVWVIFGGQLDLFLALSLNKGDLLFILGILSMSFYFILMKVLFRKDDMIVLVFCTFVGGALWMGCALQIFDQPLDWQLLQNDLLMHMAYLVIGATLATVYLFQLTTVKLGPVKVNAYIYLNPLLLALVMLIVEGHSIATEVIPGIIISVLATVILQRQTAKPTNHETVAEKPLNSD